MSDYREGGRNAGERNAERSAREAARYGWRHATNIYVGRANLQPEHQVAIIARANKQTARAYREEADQLEQEDALGLARGKRRTAYELEDLARAVKEPFRRTGVGARRQRRLQNRKARP